MPLPLAIPILGAAARLVLSAGGRQAIKKYGKVAVDKAKAEIAKRNQAIDRVAGQAARKEGLGTAPRRASRAAREEAQKQKQRNDLRVRLERQQAEGRTSAIKDEVPLRFAKGGSIDGKATRGLTRGSRRK